MQMDLNNTRPLPDAFDPRTTDDTGLSVYRHRFHSAAEAASFRTLGKSRAWIAYIPVEGIFSLGLTVVPDPLGATGLLPPQRGHALIPELTSALRQSDRQRLEVLKRALLAIVLAIEGPFSPPEVKTHPPQL